MKIVQYIITIIVLSFSLISCSYAPVDETPTENDESNNELYEEQMQKNDELTEEYNLVLEEYNSLKEEYNLVLEENIKLSDSNKILSSEIRQGVTKESLWRKQFFEYLQANRDEFTETRLFTLFDVNFLEKGDKIGNLIIDDLIYDKELTSSEVYGIEFSGELNIKGELIMIGESDKLKLSVTNEERYKIPNYYIDERIDLVLTNYNDFKELNEIENIIHKTGSFTITNISLLGEEGSDYSYQCELIAVDLD